MDKLEIKQGSFIQKTQYYIPMGIDLSVVPARLGISDLFTKLLDINLVPNLILSFVQNTIEDLI
jgi:hypothetical protein